MKMIFVVMENEKMDDYISRQAVVNVICDMHIGGKDGVANALPNTYGADIREIIEQIDSLPSLDAVEVVRCKNCKYWDESDIHSTVNPNCRCRAVIRKNYTDSEFYCAYGERKDGEQSGAD